MGTRPEYRISQKRYVTTRIKNFRLYKEDSSGTSSAWAGMPHWPRGYHHNVPGQVSRSGHVRSGLAGLGEVKWGQVRSVRVRSSQTGSLTWLSRRRQPPSSASGRRAGWWSADRSSQSHCKTTDRWRYTHSIGKDTRTEHWTLRGNMGSKPRSERSR